VSALTLASDPEDATALEAAEGHHARTAGELAGRTAMLLTAAGRDRDAAERIRAGLVAFFDREMLPHAAAEEAVLYPAARRLPDSRLLVESLIAEHSCPTALVDALRTPSDTTGAAADARALQVFFEEHVAKENGLVLPLLAAAPELRLAGLLTDMHDRLDHGDPSGGRRFPDTQESRPESGCGGGCGCGGEDEAAEPELDVRSVGTGEHSVSGEPPFRLVAVRVCPAIGTWIHRGPPEKTWIGPAEPGGSGSPVHAPGSPAGGPGRSRARLRVG
jgi:hypothetical protein